MDTFLPGLEIYLKLTKYIVYNKSITNLVNNKKYFEEVYEMKLQAIPIHWGLVIRTIRITRPPKSCLLYGLISYGPTCLYGLAVCGGLYNQAPFLERAEPPKLQGSSNRKVFTIAKISLILAFQRVTHSYFSSKAILNLLQN